MKIFSNMSYADFTLDCPSIPISLLLLTEMVYHLPVFHLMIPGALSSLRILSAANSYCKGISFEPLLTPDRSRHLQGKMYVLTYFQSVFSLTC